MHNIRNNIFVLDWRFLPDFKCSNGIVAYEGNIQLRKNEGKGGTTKLKIYYFYLVRRRNVWKNLCLNTEELLLVELYLFSW